MVDQPSIWRQTARAGATLARTASLAGIAAASLMLAACGTSAAGTAAQAGTSASAVAAPARTTVATATIASPTVTASSASTTAQVAATTTAAAGTATSGATVRVESDPKLGQFLTDAKGLTLYWYTKDTPGVSNCKGGCLTAWPAFAPSGSLSLPAGVPGSLGTITRADTSARQVTYRDMPLYYYKSDSKPGDVTGQGVGGVWFVVAPGTGPLRAPAPATSSGY